MLRTARLTTLVGILVVGLVNSAAAQGGRREAPVVRDFKSPHFLVHTDLSDKEAKELLARLERMLGLVSGYWGRPPSGVIECFVAKDQKLTSWPKEVTSQMARQGIAKIREGAGVCISQRLSNDKRFMAKAVVYAVADGGVPQHEAVHGYCQHTFGRTGPKWYAEGMAELGNYWVGGQKGVNAEPTVIAFLKENPPATVVELIANEERTGGSWQDYAKWWSLCHLLENNPNYHDQFRALGMALLQGAPNQSFEVVFGPAIDQITFEHQFFLKRIEPGLRVELIAWDWTRAFKPLHPNMTYQSVIQAGRGWQPTGLAVQAGRQYEFSTAGTWKLSKDGKAVDAVGQADGKGRLVGVLMRGYKLTNEFELGTEGLLSLSEDGDLYLRCREPWIELGDSSGRITFKVKLAERSPGATVSEKK